MSNISWLSAQAHQIHDIFQAAFYALVTCFLLIGVFIEYFRWPLGGVPAFGVLVGRALVASLLLHSYSEVSNLFADLVDGLATQLGDLNQLNVVTAKMGEKLGHFSVSWLSVKETFIQVISFVTFFLLYFSVHAIQAFMLYVWTLLYVFSPLLIAFYVLPSTSGATKMLYRSLIEVSLWKVVISVLATLLWSFALSTINQEDKQVPFMTVIFLNLILAGSLLMVPSVVHALAGAGFSGLAQSAGGLVGGMTMGAPLRTGQSLYGKGEKTYDRYTATRDAVSSGANKLQDRFFPGSRPESSKLKSGGPKASGPKKPKSSPSKK